MAMIRAQSAQGGNKVTIRLDVHRYSAAQALAKAQRQLLAEALDLAIRSRIDALRARHGKRRGSRRRAR